jgi:hypothetical protein
LLLEVLGTVKPGDGFTVTEVFVPVDDAVLVLGTTIIPPGSTSGCTPSCGVAVEGVAGFGVVGEVGRTGLVLRAERLARWSHDVGRLAAGYTRGGIPPATGVKQPLPEARLAAKAVPPDMAPPAIRRTIDAMPVLRRIADNRTSHPQVSDLPSNMSAALAHDLSVVARLPVALLTVWPLTVWLLTITLPATCLVPPLPTDRLPPDLAC